MLPVSPRWCSRDSLSSGTQKEVAYWPWSSPQELVRYLICVNSLHLSTPGGSDGIRPLQGQYPNWIFMFASLQNISIGLRIPPVSDIESLTPAHAIKNAQAKRELYHCLGFGHSRGYFKSLRS